jgi:aspartate racemase
VRQEQDLSMKHLGILAHSAEGAALCFLAACHEGERRLGAHHHPDITMDIVALGESMADWETSAIAPVRERLARSIERLAAANADFFVCPDNTAHLALESQGPELALAGLHIAEVVAEEAASRGFKKAAITGTRWTMEGPIYPRELRQRGLNSLVPSAANRSAIQTIIFDELVRGIVCADSRMQFVAHLEELKDQGCDVVILGCTELPMLLDEATSPLPVLDSTQLLARAAVEVALGVKPLPSWRGGSL